MAKRATTTAGHTCGHTSAAGIAQVLALLLLVLGLPAAAAAQEPGTAPGGAASPEPATVTNASESEAPAAEPAGELTPQGNDPQESEAAPSTPTEPAPETPEAPETSEPPAAPAPASEDPATPETSTPQVDAEGTANVAPKEPQAKAPAGGLFGRMAKSILGKKVEETPAPAGVPSTASGVPAPSTPQAEEESAENETLENQRKAKELIRTALQNIEKKRISEAKKNINDLIQLKPYEADYHLALGLCFRQEKRYKDAVKKYQDVLDLGGPKSLVNLLRAEVAAAENEKDKVFTYLKEAAVGGRNIVQDVGKLPLLEKYKADTEFIKLALHLEKFDVKSKKNQDPFTNPFPASQAPGALKPTPSTGPLTYTPLEQQNMLNEARRIFEKIQWYIKLEDETKAMENYIKLKEMIEKKDLLTLPRIVNDFRILVGRMESLETQIEGIRLKYYWNQAQARLRDLKDAFSATEYAKVDTLYIEVEKLAKEMEKANSRFKPVADRVVAAAKVWLNRSQVRREFQSAKPEIQGVVIADDAKMAIIDNRILKQGERFGEFQIQKVENNRVTFRYKGEEIPLIFRRF
jgi:tetratricopeptide (TPR) repeat protein